MPENIGATTEGTGGDWSQTFRLESYVDANCYTRFTLLYLLNTLQQCGQIVSVFMAVLVVEVSAAGWPAGMCDVMSDVSDWRYRCCSDVISVYLTDGGQPGVTLLLLNPLCWPGFRTFW